MLVIPCNFLNKIVVDVLQIEAQETRNEKRQSRQQEKTQTRQYHEKGSYYEIDQKVWSVVCIQEAFQLVAR